MNHLLPHFTLNCDLNDKNKTGGLSRQTPYFCPCGDKSKQNRLFSLRRASPLPGFRDVKNLLRWGSGPVSKGLTFPCDLQGKNQKTR